MTRFVVLKRSHGDGWMPGDILTDPESADLLVVRGFIQELPDNIEEQLPDADAKAAKAAEKAQAKADKEQADEEERLRKEGEALLLANRPDAKKLAKAMDVPLDEVFALTDDEYNQGVEAFITNVDENPDKGGDGTPDNPTIPGKVPPTSIGAAES